jgi:hypothetical protein
MKKRMRILCCILCCTFCCVSFLQGIPPRTANATAVVTATATSAQSGNEAALAVDGDPSTFWHSAWWPTMEALPQSITVDLGETKTFDTFNYLPRQDGTNGNVTEYNLYVSTDNQNYAKIVNAGTWHWDTSQKTVSFTAVTARYVRMEVTAASANVANAAEISVSDSTGGGTTPPDPEETTYYQIQSRWLSTQYLYDGGTTANYGALDGDLSLWSLEQNGGYTRIKNKSTGDYLNIAGGESAVNCTAVTDNTANWNIGLIQDSWKWIQNASNSKYLNLEGQKGYAACDMANVPDNNNWWSEQWALVYVSGPTPPVDYPQNTITVVSPDYCATVSGSTTIDFYAPGLTTATVKCWKQDTGYGYDHTVGTVALGADGHGSVVFPANDFPHGPITVVITATNGAITDRCNLQLYNQGGVVWNQGIPSAAPPAAQGMNLVFADDFNSMPSISSNGANATYSAHKPGGGDFGLIPFTDPTGEKNPFSQMDSYLRIRADTTLNSTGLISSLRADGTGVTATCPAYFECRMIAPNAIGSWPAFWLMTDGVAGGLDKPADELDTIEAYGVTDLNHDNQTGYWTSSHTWNQSGTFPTIYQNNNMTNLGGGASWYQTFHTYGTLITPTDTIYYCDNIEVGRHETTPLSKTDPFFFMINLAVGGNGWPMDLSRYGGTIDMYVDYVRVYQG